MKWLAVNIKNPLLEIAFNAPLKEIQQIIQNGEIKEDFFVKVLSSKDLPLYLPIFRFKVKVINGYQQRNAPC